MHYPCGQPYGSLTLQPAQWSVTHSHYWFSNKHKDLLSKAAGEAS